MSAKGLLLVLVDPPPAFEEELNDWYDTEHLPERAALPGFETAMRYTSLGDGPRYAAIYDLTSPDALETEAYRSVSGENFSPWTRRVTSRTHPVRLVARQAAPGDRLTTAASRLAILKIAPASTRDAEDVATCLDRSFAAQPGFLQHRTFVGIEPDRDFLLAIVEFAGFGVPAPTVDGFGPWAERIVMAATYRRYRS